MSNGKKKPIKIEDFLDEEGVQDPLGQIEGSRKLTRKQAEKTAESLRGGYTPPAGEGAGENKG